MLRSAVLLSMVVLAMGAGAESGNWPSWRGPEDTGTTETGSYPKSLESTNILWKVPMPGKGCSTPIVWNQRIFVTTPIDGQDGVMAVNWNGKVAWQVKFGPEAAGKHRNGSGSNPSAVTDGKTIAVYFKSGTLAGLDLDGKFLWQTNLVTAFGPDRLYWDYGSSPVMTRDHVIMTRMDDGESWVAAFDKASGKMRWKVGRKFETPVEGDHAYTTPLVFQHQGKEALLVWGAQHITAHDTTDGKVLWVCGDFNPEKVANWPAVASPVIAGEMVAVACGRADRNTPRFYGIKLGGSGDVTATHKAWFRDDIGTFVPTPAVYKGQFYVIRDRGEVHCIDPKTGKSVWENAFPRASGNFYASPVIANGILYGIREEGTAFVARIEPKFEILAETKLGERVIGTPVPISDRLLIRGDKNLICFGP